MFFFCSFRSFSLKFLCERNLNLNKICGNELENLTLNDEYKKKKLWENVWSP